MGRSDIVTVPSRGTSVDNDDVTVSTTVVQVLPENRHRKMALIQNVGDETIRVTTDGSDPTPTHGKRIRASESLVLVAPYCPTDEVKAIRQDSADSSVNASEIS